MKKDSRPSKIHSAEYTPSDLAELPEDVGVESIITPEEVIRNEIGIEDVESLREWNEENQL